MLAAAVPPYLYKADDNPDGGLDDATVEGFQTASGADRMAFLDDFMTLLRPRRARRSASRSASTPSASPQSRHRRPPWTASARSACTDFRPDLAKIDVPTLVIHGDSDAIVPFEVSGKRSADALADASSW